MVVETELRAKGPFVLASMYCLLEVIKQEMISRVTDPIEAIIKMDPISAAILTGKVNARDVVAADFKIIQTELLARKRHELQRSI